MFRERRWEAAASLLWGPHEDPGSSVENRGPWRAELPPVPSDLMEWGWGGGGRQGWWRVGAVEGQARVCVDWHVRVGMPTELIS